jgi:hypothetical protein
VLLVNLVRALIFFVAVLLGHTFQVAYRLDGVTMVLVASAIAFVAFFVADVAEAGLIAAFNPNDSKS